MFKKIGYSLIDTENEEVLFWGNNPDQDVSPPDYVLLPNNDAVYGSKPYETLSGGYKVVERWVRMEPATNWHIKSGEAIAFETDKTVVIYQYDLPNFEDLKTRIKAQVAQKRWEKETGGVVIDNVYYATDRESQTKYTAIAVRLSQGDLSTWSIRWKTMNGDFVVLNAVQMNDVINTILNHVQTNFDKEYDLCQEIDACQTVEELLAVDINQFDDPIVP